MIKKFIYSLINVDINYIHYHIISFWCIQIKYYCQESRSLGVITLYLYKLYSKLHIVL